VTETRRLLGRLFRWQDVDFQAYVAESLMGVLVEEMVCNRDSKFAVADLDGLNVLANGKLLLGVLERPPPGGNGP
jgi:hypothetical protein